MRFSRGQAAFLPQPAVAAAPGCRLFGVESRFDGAVRKGRRRQRRTAALQREWLYELYDIKTRYQI